MTPRTKLGAGIVGILVAAVGWSVASASENELPAETAWVEPGADSSSPLAPPTTVRDAPVPASENRVPTNADLKVIDDYAAVSGLPSDEAAEELIELARLTDAADELRRSDAGYAAFRITGHGGELVGEYATTTPALENVDPQIRVVESPLSRVELPQFSEQLSELARDSGLTNTTADTFDPFDAEIVIWSDKLTAGSSDN